MTSTTKSSLIATIVGLFSGGFAAMLLFATLVATMHFYPDTLQKFSPLTVTDVNAESDRSTISNGTSPTSQTSDNQIVDVVQQTQPAVVSVVASADVPVYEQYYQDPSADPFGGLSPFFSMPQYRQNGTEKQDVSSGSGFIVTADGYVVTNKHVVAEDNVDYTVMTNDGTQYPATVVARDPSNDVAVLKIEGDHFSYLEFGDANTLKVGQSVIAIGNALGEFSNSVSVGIVSGLARSIEAGDGYGQAEQLQNVIQTDAAINFGNSGGPLLDLSGRVIGMNVAMAQAQNIGFALPSNLIQGVVESVKTTGKISRPFLGVRYMLIDATLKESNALPVDHGVLIRRGQNPAELAVIPGSPADKAGLEENDIILEVDEQKLDAEHDLSALIGQKQVGDEIKLLLLHDGVEQTVTVTLEERAEQ